MKLRVHDVTRRTWLADGTSGLSKEQTDEEIAAEEPKGEDILFLEPESWHEIRRSPDQVYELLERAEDGDLAAEAIRAGKSQDSYWALTGIHAIGDKLASFYPA